MFDAKRCVGALSLGRRVVGAQCVLGRLVEEILNDGLQGVAFCVGKSVAFDGGKTDTFEGLAQGGNEGLTVRRISVREGL